MAFVPERIVVLSARSSHSNSQAMPWQPERIMANCQNYPDKAWCSRLPGHSPGGTMGADVLIPMGEKVLILIGAEVRILMGAEVIVLMGAEVLILRGAEVLILMVAEVLILMGAEVLILMGADVLIS